MQKRQVVLAVDLDHTLIDTDMIYLCLKQIIFKKIYLLPYIFYLRFFRGKPYAKEFLYQKTCIDVHNLPFNDDVIEYIRNEPNVPEDKRKEVASKRVEGLISILDFINSNASKEQNFHYVS